MSVFDLQSVFFIPQRAIDTFTASVTIEEKGTDQLEITDYPVDKQGTTTDHSYLLPAQLEMTVLFTVFQAPLSETYQKLLDLQSSRQPFTVVTGKRSYNSMLMQSITVVTDKTTENILSVNLSLKQVSFAEISQTSVSASKENQSDPKSTQPIEKTGEKNPQQQDEKKSISIIEAAIESFGV